MGALRDVPVIVDTRLYALTEIAVLLVQKVTGGVVNRAHWLPDHDYESRSKVIRSRRAYLLVSTALRKLDRIALSRTGLSATSARSPRSSTGPRKRGTHASTQRPPSATDCRSSTAVLRHGIVGVATIRERLPTRANPSSLYILRVLKTANLPHSFIFPNRITCSARLTCVLKTHKVHSFPFNEVWADAKATEAIHPRQGSRRDPFRRRATRRNEKTDHSRGGRTETRLA